MHRIGIISDTHGLLRPEVAEALADCEAILHGGDVNKPAILEQLNRIAPTYVVRGNNDKEWAKELPETLSVSLCGVRFFMVHNKKYIPKDEGSLTDVDLIVYGHSHKYEEKHEGGRFYLNPGSCGPRRFTQPITFAVLEVEDDGSYRIRKMEVPHTKRPALEQEIEALDIKRVVKGVMRDTNKRLSVRETAAKNGISEELAEQICRLYLTHPGVSADGIIDKMGLPKNR